jgi:exosortase
MESQSGNGILEDFRIEFSKCWQRLPNKGLFFGLLSAWLLLFHLVGNSTFGYIRSPSLFRWLSEAFIGGSASLLEADGAYGFFVPPLVLLLFWFKRTELVELELRAWVPGLWLLGAGLFVHILGYVVQQPRISVIGLILGLYGLTGLAWGPNWLRRTFFPFFLLLFCIPLGSLSEAITFPLRLLVTQMVAVISRFVLAIDVVQHGNQLIDPNNHYQYEVAAACSGIRSLFSTVLLAVVLGFVSFRQAWKRLVMVLAAVPLAVLGNLLRMMAIVIAAEAGGQEWGDFVHEGGPLGLFSLLPYVPAFIGLILLEGFLRGHTGAAPPPSPERQSA